MATTLTDVPANPKHYVWWFPGCPVRVHLDLHVVQRLKERLQGVGSEVFEEGLLFGRSLDGASAILDFEPVFDGNVASAIAALPKDSGRRFLMGYYRTEKEETFRLSPKDAALAEECFRRPYHVFLAVHSNGFTSPNATFFFRDGDRKMSDFAFLEFPLDPSLLAMAERDRIQRSHPVAISTAVEAHSPAPPSVTTAISPAHRHTLLKPILWTCSSALVFALGALVNNGSFQARFANFRHALLSPPPASSPVPPTSQPSSLPLIALHAQRQNGDLELTWSRESMLIASATSGVISIQDGPTKREIALDSGQIRGGSLLYSPTSDQIVMQLSVTTPSNTVSESVMVVLPKAGNPHVYSLQTAEPPAAGQSDAPWKKIPLAEASKPFLQPPPPKSASSSTPILTDSPALRSDPSPVSVNAPGILSLPVDLPPRPVAPPLPTPQPSASAASTPVRQPAPVVVPYQPAVAIKKVSPSFPPELQTVAVGRKVIEVTVTIDKNGKVTKAEAAPQKNVSQFLVNSAVTAARLWRFQPAVRGTEPISSEMVLRFVFNH